MHIIYKLKKITRAKKSELIIDLFLCVIRCETWCVRRKAFDLGYSCYVALFAAEKDVFVFKYLQKQIIA